VNYARDVVDTARGDALALIELRRDGGRKAWTFGEVGSAAASQTGVPRPSVGPRLSA
jgi:hypothetical protein